MFATFELESSELDANFLNLLKSCFGSGKLSVTVQNCQDTTNYLLSSEANRDALMESLEQYKAGKVSEHELLGAD